VPVEHRNCGALPPVLWNCEFPQYPARKRQPTIRPPRQKSWARLFRDSRMIPPWPCKSAGLPVTEEYDDPQRMVEGQTCGFICGVAVPSRLFPTPIMRNRKDRPRTAP